MSGYLSAAIEAAAIAWLVAEGDGDDLSRPGAVEWAWSMSGFAESRAEYLRRATAAITAAAPLIEAQVREQVAAEIEAEAERRARERDAARAESIARRAEGSQRIADSLMALAIAHKNSAEGMWDAARIARGQS